MQIWIDFLRTAIPMALLFGLLPAFAARCGDKWPVPWRELLVPAFLRTALFLELSCLLLGSWRLCLAGMVFGLYAGWLILSTVLASRKRWLYSSESWRLGYGWLLGWAEHRPGLGKLFSQSIVLTFGYFFLGLFVTGAFLHFAWHPVHNLRFLEPLGYQRSISLQTLVIGSPWTPDPSVALLVPVLLASGLDAAAVVRFSVPLLYLMMICSVAYCAHRYSDSARAASLAVGLFFLYSKGPGFAASTAADGSQWGSLFLILAVAVIRKSFGYAACAMLLAWLMSSGFPELFVVALGSILVGLLLHGLFLLTPPTLRQLATTGLIAGAALSLTTPFQSLPADGPLQYESAARTADRIAREFPRNRWLIVSPMHEMAYSYGRGWHAELPQFLREFQPDKVREPAFRFPYEFRDLFVFIEKRPLAQASSLAVPGNDGNSFYYSTNAGRASMAFRAAEMMAAYKISHPNAEVFFEDENLAVYRILLGER